MFKLKKEITYSFVGSDTPVKKEDLAKYGDLALFFVTNHGKILHIDRSLPEVNRYMHHLSSGKYMYKDQLEEMIFGAATAN